MMSEEDKLRLEFGLLLAGWMLLALMVLGALFV